MLALPLAMKPEEFIPEMVQDSWFRHGVSTEQVEHNIARERLALQPTARVGTPLPAQVRTFAVQYMSSIMRNLGMNLQEWFQAVSLLDTYCLKVAGDIPMLPMTCICAMRLVKKLNKSQMPASTQCQIDWLPIARGMAREMAIAGIQFPEFTEETLNSHEKVIHHAVECQMDVMTVERWISIFSMRYYLLTGDCIQEHMQGAVTMAHGLVMLQPASVGFSHYNIALGVFSSGLTMANLVPPGILCRPGTNSNGASEGNIPTMGNDSIQGSMLPDDQLSSIIRVLEAVTCCELQFLQLAVRNVMPAMASLHARRLPAA